MTGFSPSTRVTEDGLLAQLFEAAPTREVAVDCVVDSTRLGQIIGVEILDLKRQLGGGSVDPPAPEEELRWAYDDEIDAFYLHIADGQGEVQRSAVGRVRLDSTDRVVQVEVPLSSVA